MENIKQSVGAKPILLPNPVLIIGTYDDNGVPNIIMLLGEEFSMFRGYARCLIKLFT